MTNKRNEDFFCDFTNINLIAKRLKNFFATKTVDDYREFKLISLDFIYDSMMCSRIISRVGSLSTATS